MQHKIEIKIADSPADFSVSKDLILDYVKWLGIDLSFQNFDDEINNLKSMYFEPVGGLVITTVNGEAAGVAGIRKYDSDACELKRMFVKSDFRNLGIGKKMLQASIMLARNLKYKSIKLDTADFMTEAVKLYQSNGFVEIPPYRHNPMESAKYFELILKNE
ncbi:MAG: GNAT family N-acetyltransferase [Chryseolinea sp.]